MTEPADPSVETVIQRLREGATVLDEPFHHDAIAVAMLEAADLLSTLQRERDSAQNLANIYGDAVAEWRPIVERAESAEAEARAARSSCGRRSRD